MSSSSFPETPPRPSRAPRLLSAVSGDKALAVASFEAGWMRRAMTAASARSRWRQGFRLRMRGRPSWVARPSRAATCPCGSDLRMAAASSRVSKTTPPWRKVADGVDAGFGDFRKVGEGLSPEGFSKDPYPRCYGSPDLEKVQPARPGSRIWGGGIQGVMGSCPTETRAEGS